MSKLWNANRRLVGDRVAEGLREGALLWFVFSALDALVTGGFTLRWFTAKSAGAMVVWTIGMYVEVAVKELA
jgi:NADPH-dependent 2,4-dienoyl-CoA reductase/sulfur reductase-like enzyme